MYGVEYQIYFCVAVLKELQEGIRTAAREGNLLTFLNEFKMTSSTTTTMEMDSEVCLDYMRALDERYGDIVRKEMR